MAVNLENADASQKKAIDDKAAADAKVFEGVAGKVRWSAARVDELSKGDTEAAKFRGEVAVMALEGKTDDIIAALFPGVDSRNMSLVYRIQGDGDVASELSTALAAARNSPNQSGVVIANQAPSTPVLLGLADNARTSAEQADIAFQAYKAAKTEADKPNRVGYPIAEKVKAANAAFEAFVAKNDAANTARDNLLTGIGLTPNSSNGQSSTAWGQLPAGPVTAAQPAIIFPQGGSTPAQSTT